MTYPKNNMSSTFTHIHGQVYKDRNGQKKVTGQVGE